MGSFWSKYGECGTTTGMMVLSFLLAILGIALVYTLVGIFIGIPLLIAAWIIFLISLIMLGKVLITKKWKDHTTFCKVNVGICIGLLIILIVLSAVGGNEHQNQTAQKPPVPSNEASTAPASN